MMKEVIKKIRAYFDLSQRAFAKSIGVHHNRIADWETDKRKPSRESLLKITEHHNVIFVITNGKITTIVDKHYISIDENGEVISDKPIDYVNDIGLITPIVENPKVTSENFKDWIKELHIGLNHEMNKPLIKGTWLTNKDVERIQENIRKELVEND